IRPKIRCENFKTTAGRRAMITGCGAESATDTVHHSAWFMARRPLRKIDPALDLSRHFIAADQLPRPWDAAALFGRTAPLEVEVGSGKGLFLTQAATTQPNRDFLGIEISAKYAQYSAARL